MAGRINEDDIRTLKERLDIVAVISPYTTLKGSGNGMTGRCPFHDEKTPSFSVSPSRGVYHCFGCGASGDGIKFVQEIEALSFIEAVEKLGRQFGIDLRKQELRPGERATLGRHTRLLEILAEADEFYRDQLKGEAGAPARSYLQGRGIDPGMLTVFGLGWAPDAWDEASTHLLGKGATAKDLYDAGLAKQGQRGPIDRFRARLLFPIRDKQGDNVVAFGGRILPSGPVVTRSSDGEAPPKYINSPTSDVYDKSTTLYGLHLARRDIVRRAEALVVEGYLDVIALHQVGMKQAVAPCGTALTEQHFQMLSRLGARVTLSLDADSAGFDAAERARERAEKAELADLGVLVLPDGKDPADLVAEGGAAAVASALAARKTALEFQIEHLLRNADYSTPEAQAAAYRSTFDLLGRLTEPALRYKYVFDVVAPAVGLPAQRIEDELNLVHPIGRAARPVAVTAPTRGAAHDPQIRLEREILQAALQRPELLPEDWQVLDEEAFTHERSRTLFRAIIAAQADLDGVLDRMPDDEMRGSVRGLVAEGLPAGSDAPAIQVKIDALRGRHAHRRKEAAKQRLAEAYERLSPEERRELMEEIRSLEALARSFGHVGVPS